MELRWLAWSFGKRELRKKEEPRAISRIPSGWQPKRTHLNFVGSCSFLSSVPCCCCCYKVTSVVSDLVRPHGRQPTRLHCPWDSPGKNTGVGCHFLLQCMKVRSESEVAQSWPTLCDPMDCSPPGSSIHWILQARVLEWGAIAFSTVPRYCSMLLFLNSDPVSWYFPWHSLCTSPTRLLAIPNALQTSLRVWPWLFSLPGMALLLISAWLAPFPPPGLCLHVDSSGWSIFATFLNGINNYPLPQYFQSPFPWFIFHSPYFTIFHSLFCIILIFYCLSENRRAEIWERR